MMYWCVCVCNQNLRLFHNECWVWGTVRRNTEFLTWWGPQSLHIFGLSFQTKPKILNSSCKEERHVSMTGEGDGAAESGLWVTERKSRGQCVKSDDILFGMRNTAESNRTLSILFKVIITIRYLGLDLGACNGKLPNKSDLK